MFKMQHCLTLQGSTRTLTLDPAMQEKMYTITSILQTRKQKGKVSCPRIHSGSGVDLEF